MRNLIKKIYGTSCSLRQILYSAFLKKMFKSVGHNLRIFPSAHIIGGEYITLGNNVKMMRGLRLNAISYYPRTGQKFEPVISIGDNFSCGDNVHIGAINHIIIGDNVLLGSRIYITDHQHGKIDEEEKFTPPLNRFLYSKGSVIIEDDVFIGDGVVILPGVTVGKGSIIGANSVVTRDVKEYSVVAGTPARVLKEL